MANRVNERHNRDASPELQHLLFKNVNHAHGALCVWHFWTRQGTIRCTAWCTVDDVMHFMEQLR